MKNLVLSLLFAMAFCFSANAQVATKAAQDTSNARLSLIKTAVYSSSAQVTLSKKTTDTLAQSLRVIIAATDSNSVYSSRIANAVDSNSVYQSRLNTGLTANTATATLIKKNNDTLAQSLRTIIIATDSNSVYSSRIANGTDSNSVYLARNNKTGKYAGKISSTIVMSVAGAYATGDYMGTSTTPQAFTSFVRESAGTGTIKDITISDKGTTSPVNMELWLLSATFTAPTDNGAWTISDAEALTVQAIIPISSSGWFASGANQIYYVNGLNIVVKPGATSLFYALVARGTTPAYTSSDLTITLSVEQN